MGNSYITKQLGFHFINWGLKQQQNFTRFAKSQKNQCFYNGLSFPFVGNLNSFFLFVQLEQWLQVYQDISQEVNVSQGWCIPAIAY